MGPPRSGTWIAFRIVSYDTSLQSIYKLNKLTFYETPISPALIEFGQKSPGYADIERESIWERAAEEW
jgi:hypothetical protein